MSKPSACPCYPCNQKILLLFNRLNWKLVVVVVRSKDLLEFPLWQHFSFVSTQGVFVNWCSNHYICYPPQSRLQLYSVLIDESITLLKIETTYHRILQSQPFNWRSTRFVSWSWKPWTLLRRHNFSVPCVRMLLTCCQFTPSQPSEMDSGEVHEHIVQETHDCLGGGCLNSYDLLPIHTGSSAFTNNLVVSVLL